MQNTQESFFRKSSFGSTHTPIIHTLTARTSEWGKIIKRLRENDPTLTHLCIGKECDLNFDLTKSSNSFRQLCDALAVNHTLETLDIEYHFIDFTGAQALVDALKNNRTLTTLKYKYRYTSYSPADSRYYSNNNPDDQIKSQLYNCLARNRAYLQQQQQKKNMLLEVAHTGDSTQLRNLLAQQPDLAYKAPNTQKTALHISVEAGHLEATKLLLAAGADLAAVDAKGNTPLHMATLANHIKLVELLLQKGALRDVKNQQGLTPVQIASQYQREAMVQLLLPLPAERKAKGHTIVGQRYALINKITRSEAKELHQQTGLSLTFPPEKAKIRPIIAQGQFGKLRIARNVTTGQFIGVKKIKGHKQIEASKQEGYLQWQLKDKSHIMPLLDTLELPADQDYPRVLYQFMPIAALGNGEALAVRLAAITDENLKICLLVHIAQGLLTGLSHMHSANTYHLDIKPANLVMDQNGIVYVVDFGWAIQQVAKQDGKVQIIPKYDQEGSPLYGAGDFRYFSPERAMVSYIGTQEAFDAAKADAWAAGITLWELAKAFNPFSRESANRDDHYYQTILDDLSELQRPKFDSFWQVVKMLLAINPEERLTVGEALDLPVFKRPTFHFKNEEARLVGLASLKAAEPDRARELTLWNERYDVGIKQTYSAPRQNSTLTIASSVQAPPLATFSSTQYDVQTASNAMARLSIFSQPATTAQDRRALQTYNPEYFKETNTNTSSTATYSVKFK